MNPMSTTAPSRADRAPGRGWPVALAVTALCLGLAACGGGGGGGAATPTALGLVKVTVSDAYGAAVEGATVMGPRGPSITDALGVALVPVDSPDSTAAVRVSRDSFVDKTIEAVSTTGQLNELKVTLDRAMSVAGGSLATRSGLVPTIDADAQQMSFEIELIVVDGAARPVENLVAADFALRPCTPTAADAQTACVSGAGAAAAYTPATSAPEASALVAGLTATPFASALLLDQSGSINQSDPTGARLFSTKAFLGGLGDQDRVVLAAFAAGHDARIPNPPLTVFAPFGDAATAPAYFSTLDSLSSLVGGNSPLYDSLDSLQQQLASDTTLPVGLPKAVVVFTDGADTGCGDAQACRTRRAQSIRSANDHQVRVFTIGLSSGVDIAALGELANQTGGALLYADGTAQLLPLYGTVGRLLSLSLPTYRLRWTVQAAEPGMFKAGGTLLGRVQVRVGAEQFDVPFVVGIP